MGGGRQGGARGARGGGLFYSEMDISRLAGCVQSVIDLLSQVKSHKIS